MLTRTSAIALTLLTVFGITSSLTLAATRSARPKPAEYRVDSVHSSVFFKVQHKGLSFFYARFNDFSGSFTLDEEDPSACSVEVEVAAGSVDTRSTKLNKHLLSPDFFDAEKHPKINFKSTEVKQGEKENTFVVSGELTLLGVTKPLEIQVTKTGSGKGRRGGAMAGFHTTFTIDRGDFGMDYGIQGGGIGREVELTVSVEAGSR